MAKKTSSRKTASGSTRRRTPASKRRSARGDGTPKATARKAASKTAGARRRSAGGSRTSRKSATARDRGLSERRAPARKATSRRTRKPAGRKAAAPRRTGRSQRAGARRTPGSTRARTRRGALDVRGRTRTASSPKWIESTDQRADRPGQTLATQSHDVIQKWAEERGGEPATVASTRHGNRAGVLRLNFPGYGGQSLQAISWDDWFRSFDDRDLVFLYQDRLANGRQSNFFRLDNPDREDG